jgi:acetyl-CoA carboxylase carboxyltransferase component
VVIYSDSADKATRFVPVQSEKNPLVLFRMLPVLWWDLNQKQGGIIKTVQNG